MPTNKKVAGINVVLEYITSDDSVGVGHKIGSTVKDLARAVDVDVAMDFNFADNNTGTPIGLVMVGGKVVNKDIPKTQKRDSFCVQDDGSFAIDKPNANTKHSVQGSPRLLQAGKNILSQSIVRDQTASDIATGSNYRVAVGVISPKQAVLVRTVDKVTLSQLTTVMQELGCNDALNGDGGGSAYLYPFDNGRGRKMGSAITVKKEVSKVIRETNPTLIIDAGHGGNDPGASGNGIIEKNMVLDISLYQYNRFKELGVKVALTRDTDKTIDSTPRATLVKNSGAKYCISNHINAAASASAQGAEIIHSIYNDSKLAKAFAEALKAAGQVLRPTSTFSKAGSAGDYYFMHHQTGSVTTNIVEYGFCTNAPDAIRLKENWQVYAEAIVKEFCSFIGHKYVAPKGDSEVGNTTNKSGFADVPDNHWAATSIEKAADKGVIKGVSDELYDPNGTVTRAQLAVILDRAGLLEK